MNTQIRGKFECDLIMVFVPLWFWARFPAPSDLDSQSALHPLTALRQWQCTVDMISYKDQNHKIALVSKQWPWYSFKIPYLLKSSRNERTIFLRHTLSLSYISSGFVSFRGFEPQLRRYFFLKSDIKWAFSYILIHFQ